MGSRFLPQSTLDSWQDQGKAEFHGDKFVDLATKAEFKIEEALHFVRLESGLDTHSLVKHVKSIARAKEMGAEHYMTSVILGETVYEVVPGWIAEDPSLVAGVASAAPIAAPGAAPPPKVAENKKFGGKNQEADALAKLLLDKLS